MAVTMTTIRLDTDLADEAVKVLGAKSRTDAVHIALREISVREAGPDNGRERIKLMRPFYLRHCLVVSPQIKEIKGIPVRCGRIIRI